ncbi:MAG: dihydroneopterin aldolase [Selenomonadaceae bacterium]|nr:dihydroneopterin aldolase [Selenomonadaceae bacterium]
MSDKVIITGIEIFGRHGVGELERRRGQVFKIDVEMDLDLVKAGFSDDIKDTVDYAEVIYDIDRIVSGPPRNLIETVAEEIAETLLKSFRRLERIKVTVHKPNAQLPVKYADAAVSIVRWRR